MIPSPPSRLLSLDVFRGLTIAGMILVNNPGSWETIYAPLRHAAWHGCTPTDLVFPFFLFIVGVALTLSLSHRKERGDDRGRLLRKIIGRTLSIFLLGVLLNGFPHYHLEDLRIMGVLQRIALVYGVTAALFLFASVRTQATVGGAVLLAYWGLLTLVPVPGHGPANLAPATNLAAWLDHLVLGRHVWSVSAPWDPEGILSTLPAIATGIAGLLLGHWLRTNHAPGIKTARIMAAGALATAAGMVWSLWFPFNKALWTSSFALCTAGLATLVFGVIFWLVDVKQITRLTKPCVLFGTNALAAYVLAGLIATAEWEITVAGAAGNAVSLHQHLYAAYFLPHFAPLNASLAWAVIHVLLVLGAMWMLHARKIFIRL